MLALANRTIKFPLNFPQRPWQETSLRGFAPIRVCYVHTRRVVTNENTEYDYDFCDTETLVRVPNSLILKPYSVFIIIRALHFGPLKLLHNYVNKNFIQKGYILQNSVSWVE